MAQSGLWLGAWGWGRGVTNTAKGAGTLPRPAWGGAGIPAGGQGWKGFGLSAEGTARVLWPDAHPKVGWETSREGPA